MGLFLYCCIQIQMRGEDKVVISKLKTITVISFIFMIVEILGGYYAHSIAIFADAFHLLSDVLAYVISLFAVLMSYRASPKGLTFGYEKLQPLGALVNIGIIWFVTAELFIEATHRIFYHSVVEEPKYMLATSIFGLVCNLYIMKVLHSDEHAGGHHNCSHSHHRHQSQQVQAISEETHHHDQHGACSHGHNHAVPEKKSLPQPEKQDHKHHDCKHEHEHEHEHEHNHDHEHEHNHEPHEHHDSHQQHQHNEGDSCRNFIRQIPTPHSHSGCSHSHAGEHAAESTNLKLHDELRISNNASDEEIKSKPKSKQDNFHNNINIKAAYIHIITDIILSIGVIISASIIYFFAPEGHVWSYWQIADPVCTYLFSVMAIYTTLPILKESLNFLLDGCDDVQLVYEIEEELRDSPIVEKVQNLKVWSLTRGKYYGALRLRVKQGSRRQLSRIFSSRKIQGFVQFVQEESHLIAEQ